jgi:hypothetical protein
MEFSKKTNLVRALRPALSENLSNGQEVEGQQPSPLISRPFFVVAFVGRRRYRAHPLGQVEGAILKMCKINKY